MRILTVGGGSGGHVTPVAAVINELKRQQSDSELQFWCDKRFAPQARRVMQHTEANVVVKTVAAGKLRRYHGVSLWRQLADIPTVLQNLVDVLKIIAGFFQSFVRLLLWRPQVVFLKGGFVCLPVGLAAHCLRIPLVIHDSDTLPGLTNRVLARYAQFILTGAPLENYNYPASRAEYVGIPVDSDFYPRRRAERQRIKKELHLDPAKPLLVVTGGGLGARKVNDALIAIGPSLEGLQVIHIAGATEVDRVKAATPRRADYRVLGFVAGGMPELFAAADVVITRAGANALQELAATAAPTIIIPNGMLTGGHQLKNAAVFEKAGAALVIKEESIMERPAVLREAIHDLLANTTRRQALGVALNQFARPEAAKRTASAIIEIVKKKHELMPEGA